MIIKPIKQQLSKDDIIALMLKTPEGRSKFGEKLAKIILEQIMGT
jgi:hypothetical protein